MDKNRKCLKINFAVTLTGLEMNKRQRKKTYQKWVKWWIENSEKFSEEIIGYHPITVLS
jgi:hypothetical protein